MEIRSSSVSKARQSDPKAVGKKVKTRNTSNLSKDKINELLTQLRALAWAGRHGQVIELASQTLGLSGLKPDIQIDLLDLRAESYFAQGKLDLVARDADVSMRRAKLHRTGELYGGQQ